MASLQLTYEKAQEHIALLKGWNRDASTWPTSRVDDVKRVIEAGWGKFLRAHTWSFLTVRGTVSAPKPYSTGTVEVAAASGGSVVTLTGGTFPTWAADGELSVDGSQYLVLARTSDTEIILENADVTVAAGESFTLSQFRFDLPSDFGALAGPITYESSDTNKRYPLQSTHESTIRMRYMDRNNATDSETPRLYAVYPRSHDLTAQQQWVLELYPPAQSSLLLRFMYRSWPEALDGTNNTPPGCEMHAQTLLEAILSEAETMLNASSREWSQKFEQGLQRSIKLDQQSAAPEQMPNFRNPTSDAYYADLYDEGVNPFVMDGITIYEGHEDAF